MPAKPKKDVVFKIRTDKGRRNKWQSMNTCVFNFLSRDVLSTHTVRKYGATPADFRMDALKYCIKRHISEFKFETAYDYFKDKPKWLRDAAQHKRDGKVTKKKTRWTQGKEVDKIRATHS